MSPIKDILNAIERIKKKKTQLSKKDIITILRATKSVSNNQHFIDNLIFFYNSIGPEHHYRSNLLTPREKEILHLIGLGHHNQDIAKQLDLSISTVETHRKNTRKKLKLSGNGKLLKFAILHNLQNTATTF